MHQSFVTTRGWAGDSGANVRGSDLFNSLAVPGKAGLVILRKYTSAMTLSNSRSPQCRTFGRTVMDEKSRGSAYK